MKYVQSNNKDTSTSSVTRTLEQRLVFFVVDFEQISLIFLFSVNVYGVVSLVILTAAGACFYQLLELAGVISK